MGKTIGRCFVTSAALGTAVAVMVSGGPAPEIHSVAPPAFDDKTVVLFDGSSWDGWVQRDGSPSQWVVQEDGSVLATGGAMGLTLMKRGPTKRILLVFAVAHIVPVVIAFATARFRVPLLVVLILGLAHLVTERARSWREADTRHRGLAVLAIWGNIVTAWSWFGVNELQVGLHSYGFTEGVLLFLAAWMVGNLLLFGSGLIPRNMWRSNVPRNVVEAQVVD